MSVVGSSADEAHPLLADYLRSQSEARRGNRRDGRVESRGDARGARDEDLEGSSIFSTVRWTTCDEVRRCTCAVMSFVALAALVGTALVLFWFMWAWFVLWLDLPGILTPIVWLCGFLAPLCTFRVLSMCRCGRCCGDPLTPPEVNAWKTSHLWNERRIHVDSIVDSVPLPYQIGEIISDYCFHSDMLVTAHKNKLIGIYPDSATSHTIAEFSQTITDVVIPDGNIRSVLLMVRREKDSNDADGESSVLRAVSQWLWDPIEFVDTLVCQYDLGKGHLVASSPMFLFEQLSNTTMQQLKGIYYEASYRLLYDRNRGRVIASRDGEFVVLDEDMNHLERRELIARPENGDDREQFVHLREYKWRSAVVIPPRVVEHVIAVVDAVEHTNSVQLIDDEEVYVLIPFGDHALFVGNVRTGWLRYLDFSHVEPISGTEIHHVEFSQDNQYMYLCLTQTLALMNVSNFQPLLVVPYTHLDYTVPCGIVRLPPEELQVATMCRYYSRRNHSRTQTPSKEELTRKLESVCVFFASTRVLIDPRVFLYRFPANKCRVVTRLKGKKRQLLDAGWLLERYSNVPGGFTNDDSHGGWQFVTLKHRPWKFLKEQETLVSRNVVINTHRGKETEGETNQERDFHILSRS